MRARIRFSASLALAASLLAITITPAATAQATKVQRAESPGTLGDTGVAPSAADLIARHVQAIGGRDAVMAIAAMRTEGKMDMPAQGISASMHAVAAPDKSAARITIPGIGDITNGFDGHVAWEVNPLLGPRIKTAKETAVSHEDADFRAAMLFAAERYASVETVGLVDYGGEKTWQVKTVLKSGRVIHEFFSVATGLQAGSQSTAELQSGPVNVSTRNSDYKQFGAVKIATRTEMLTGAQKAIVTITSVQLGTLSDSVFALPDAVKALKKP